MVQRTRDRLREIKRRMGGAAYLNMGFRDMTGDIRWLVEEVERLRQRLKDRGEADEEEEAIGRGGR